ncbi:hypothetical protein PybrP1_009395 [[Pythium] brassicae (nom. inval.)]|nr:hypothetical protein PybrP1_009395 [[Pythium] brassicae (nom. inval.)]
MLVVVTLAFRYEHHARRGQVRKEGRGDRPCFGLAVLVLAQSCDREEPARGAWLQTRHERLVHFRVSMYPCTSTSTTATDWTPRAPMKIRGANLTPRRSWLLRSHTARS